MKKEGKEIELGQVLGSRSSAPITGTVTSSGWPASDLATNGWHAWTWNSEQGSASVLWGVSGEHVLVNRCLAVLTENCLKEFAVLRRGDLILLEYALGLLSAIRVHCLV